MDSQADVMLEYPVGEALALLTKNKETAETNLEQLQDDLNFLRDQITTTEVSIRKRRIDQIFGEYLSYAREILKKQPAHASHRSEPRQ
jgi:hypothetical protein